MKSAIILTTLVGSAAAFAPSQHAASTTALSAEATKMNKFAGEIGAQAPLGFFDPMGFLAEEDDQRFWWFREAEIKHGRISMLAVIGYLATYAGARIPGMEDVPAGLGVFDKELYSGLALYNVQATIATIVLLETVFVKDAYGVSKFPGDYLNGKNARWDETSDEWKSTSRAKELNNGRAAMMGIMGLVVHENIGNVDELLPFITKV